MTLKRELKSKIIRALVIKGIISRKTLLDQLFLYYYDSNELDEMMHAFEQSGLAKLNMIGDQAVYEMPEHIRNQWREFFDKEDERV